MSSLGWPIPVISVF
jgi:hypothetical protein